MSFEQVCALQQVLRDQSALVRQHGYLDGLCFVSLVFQIAGHRCFHAEHRPASLSRKLIAQQPGRQWPVSFPPLSLV